MDIGRIAHAGLVISTERNRIFMDPVLRDPFACTTNRFWPEIALDTRAAADLCRTIVLSHYHPDHFSVPSLALLPRQAPVFYPRGDVNLEGALRRLRFMDLRPLAAGDKHKLHDLEIFASESRVAFKEVGVCFRDGTGTCWNLVDTVVDEDGISAVKREMGPVDVMIAQFQPFIQGFNEFPLREGFPVGEYGRLVGYVGEIAPSVVIPGACGFLYSTAWLNRCGFPMSEAQFLEDVAEVSPQTRPVRLRPGDVFSLGSRAVKEQALGFVKCTADPTRSEYTWRPTDGIPPLGDDDPFSYGAELLEREVPRYLDDAFLQQLNGPSQLVWRANMARRKVRWRLEVVYPDGLIERRMLDFSREPLAWQEDGGEYAKVHTACAASMVLGVLRGEMDGYAPMFGMMRWSRRIYFPTRAGVALRSSERDEPLTRILLDNAFLRHVDHSLRQLGL